MQYGFYYDQSRCIGCNACTVACKDYNQVNPGPVRWRKQENYETGNSVFENLTMSCNHCEEPACLTACAANAITKTDTGIVLVNRKKCQNLRSCITACPFSSLHIAEKQQEPVKLESWKVEHPVQKCKFCWERVKDGEKPVCVSACPVHALDFGDINDIARRADVVRLNKSDFPYAYKQGGNDNTKPSFFIKKRKALKVTNTEKPGNN